MVITKSTWYFAKYKEMVNGKKVGAWHLSVSYKTKKEAIEERANLIKQAKRLGEPIYCIVTKKIVTYKDGYSIDLSEGDIRWLDN